MKRLAIFIFAIGINFSVLAGWKKVNTTVHFETDRYDLDSEAISTLLKFTQDIDRTNDYHVILSGHTDNRASNSYNDNLSENRSIAVLKFLVSHGVEESSINMTFHGERRPIEVNNNEEHMRLNRRVEVSYASYYFDSEEDLKDSLGIAGKSIFTIDPQKTHVLKGKGKIELKLKAGLFLYSDGSQVYEKVLITMEEATDYLAYFSHDLVTVSDGRMLQSGGMFKLTAVSSSGAEVMIDPGNPIIATIPVESKVSGMTVFISKDGSNWTNTGMAMLDEIIPDTLAGEPPLNIPDLRLKHYIPDERTKPRAPVYPKEPRLPYYPRKESYQVNINFWNYLFRKRIIRRAEERFQNAVAQYNDKLDKYEVRYAKYLEDKRKYRAKCKEYSILLRNWHQQNQVEAEKYYVEQKRLYMMKCGKQLEERNIRLKESWASKAESYREYADRRKTLEQERLEKAQASLEKRLNGNLANLAELNFYSMQVMSMGWINCDRFYGRDSDNKILAIWDNDQTDEQVSVLFPDINAMLGAYRDGESYMSQSFPRDERAIVFALKLVDGKPHIFCAEVKSETENIEMNFRESKFSELKTLLTEIRYADLTVL